MNGYWLTAIVGGVGSCGIVWMWFAHYVLAEVETERTDLARQGHPCQQLTRYQK